MVEAGTARRRAPGYVDEVEFARQVRPRIPTLVGMPTLSQTLAFAVTATILVVIPGPSVLFTIGRALTIGRRGALLTVAGNALGMVVQVAAVALGLAALIETSAHVYTAIKLLGAAYLVFLGVKAIVHRRALVGDTSVAPVIRT